MIVETFDFINVHMCVSYDEVVELGCIFQWSADRCIRAAIVPPRICRVIVLTFSEAVYAGDISSFHS